MTLTIEDGSIVAGADSWATVAELDDYASLYGYTITATDGEKEVMLRKAQRAISTRYTFAGAPVSAAQTTCLPRYWGRKIKRFVIEADTIPQDFKDAQCAMAVSISQGLDPFTDRTADTAAKGAVTLSRSKAGPVETETEYSDTSGAAGYDVLSMGNYTAVKAMLSPYLAASGGQVRLLRG